MLIRPPATVLCQPAVRSASAAVSIEPCEPTTAATASALGTQVGCPTNLRPRRKSVTAFSLLLRIRVALKTPPILNGPSPRRINRSSELRFTSIGPPSRHKGPGRCAGKCPASSASAASPTDRDPATLEGRRSPLQSSTGVTATAERGPRRRTLRLGSPAGQSPRSGQARWHAAADRPPGQLKTIPPANS